MCVLCLYIYHTVSISIDDLALTSVEDMIKEGIESKCSDWKEVIQKNYLLYKIVSFKLCKQTASTSLILN